MTSTAPYTQASVGPSCVRAGHEISIRRDSASTPAQLTDADAVWPARCRRIVRAALSHWHRSDLAETAELLTTELVTNAFRHGSGPDVGFRISLAEEDLLLEVNDGSPTVPVPRSPGPDDENGRGLFLVGALAESWGVSADGTTTWCTLPLTKGSPDMEPAAVTAPVLREMPLELPPDSTAVTIARVSGRTKLTLLDWPGNGHAAIAVLSSLVDNAVAYGLTGAPGQSLSARLGVTEARELVIDVTDPNPKFPNFVEAVDGTIGRGLWNARQHGARLTWFVASDFEGKTVRATLQPGPVDL
ncbi:ATP-binding protein [Streptomyces olivaceus]|uniref:ATP-binding protein n=1 Tax=Streptomyces olivaceus TaxID=47716 RepID=UPI001CCC1F51|nr:ATP-binding protein [Streptomyces olivaceus]MBZ6253595.1 ATP-binding protein [Streptomyces olivaceus]